MQILIIQGDKISRPVIEIRPTKQYLEQFDGNI